jgi:hypothetical protein
MHEALLEAGKREIGGILMGEHVGVNTFRVKELTIQKKGGTFATFVRLVGYILGPLQNFFRSTNHDYSRFNYLGEWHSHHSFNLTPSSEDHRSMLGIVNDPEVGANFAVLLIVRSETGVLRGGVTVYRPSSEPFHGTMVMENTEPS